MSKVSYASAIGSIMYAMLCTTVDVAHALSVTSRFQQDLGESHWSAVKSIFKYLRRTKGQFLVYGGEEELIVNSYTDAAFQINVEDSKSQYGYVFCLIEVLIAGRAPSRTPLLILLQSLSTLQLRKLQKRQLGLGGSFLGLGVVSSILDTIELHCDNNGPTGSHTEQLG